MPERHESLLPRISLTRPVTVVMTFVALLAVGYIAYTRIPIQLLPSGYTPPFLGIWVPYGNANPQEVAEQIARPVEEILGTVRGIRKIESNSSSSGCWTWVEFAQRADMNLAYTLVRDRVDRVKADLPDDVERIYVRKFSDQDDPIIWATVSFEWEETDPYSVIDTHIKRRIERIDGVANVEIWGAYEKMIQVEIDHEKVEAHSIPMYRLIQRLRNDNFSLPSGSVREGGKKFFVRSLGRYRSLDEIADLPIDGTGLRLKDIAHITYSIPEKTWMQRVNRKTSIGVGVYKESAANTVSLCREIVDVLRNDVPSRLRGVKIDILFDQGRYITESIDNLKGSGLWGGIFAAMILFFFLRAVRITAMITLAIPLSLLITVVVMYFIGWSLNIITMMGLMLGVGMVVDNSIVVVENIYRLRVEGRSPTEAAISGAGEVALAITMATLTSIVVFLPLILMNDDVGFAFYMLRIGLPVIVALLASLFVALLFIPLAAASIVGVSRPREAPSVNRVNAVYQRGLSWVLRHRLDATLIILLLFATVFYPAKHITKTDEAQGNINDFFLLFDFPDNYSLDETDRTLARLEAFLFEREQVYRLKAVDLRFRAGWGRVRVFLEPLTEVAWWEVLAGKLKRITGIEKSRRMTRQEVIADVMEKMPRFPGTEVSLGWNRDAGNRAGVSVRLYGNDTPTLVALAHEVERRLRAIPDLLSVETDIEKAAGEIHLIIDRDRARRYGVNPQVITGTVASAVRGIDLPRYRMEEREVPVRVQYEKRDRETLDQLRRMTFQTEAGEEVPLATLATARMAKGVGEIHREEGKTVLRITATTTKDNLNDLFGQVDRVMTGFEPPRGYRWDKGERFSRAEESNRAQQFAIILAITFVFLLMGILFESFILPLSVLLAIPFAFFGLYWILYLTGTPFDIMAGIGLIILIGVVVNNAIVLIDFVNRLRADGVDRFTALLEGGKHRFRPILMTTGTTVLGLVPMAVGHASLIGIPYAPLGRTMIGGLIASTMLTLIVVPLFYTFFDDLRTWWKQEGENRTLI